MKFKKRLVIICLIVCLFCVSGVWASDAEGNLTANDLNDDAAAVDLDTQVAAFEDNQEDVLSSNASDVLSSDMADDVVSSNPKTFTDLNDVIQNSTGNDIYLNSSYAFDNDLDYSFKGGIGIDREGLTIHGNGHTLDGSNLARIFYVQADVVFKDIVFINGNAYNGGAIYGIGSVSSVVNCTFVNNHARVYGGAIYSEVNSETGCSISNSSFIKNHAGLDGGAVYCYYKNSFIDCKFIENAANQSSAAVECQWSNSSFKKCSFTGNSAKTYVITLYGDASFSDCNFTGNSGRVILINGKGDIENSNFDHNSNDNGISCINFNGIHSNHTVRLCKFISNTGKDEIISSSMDGGFSVIDCAFKTNKGKILYCPDSIVNCTFISNTIEVDYGIFNANSIEGCIFKGNVAKKDLIIGWAKSCVNCSFEDNSASLSVVGGVDSCINCNFTENSGYAVGSSRNVTNCRFVKNTGGTLYVSKSCEGCTFIDNYRKDSGGAIFSDGASIVNCTFTGNSAGYNGGAITGSGSVNGCSFNDNVAEYNGGAIYGSFSIEGCSFVKNVAGLDGGAVFAMNSKLVKDCNFSYNRAEECGGALTFAHQGDIRNTLSSRVENCRFINNKVTTYGGALSGGTCTNCYFSGNNGLYGTASYETRIVPYPKTIVAPAVTTSYNANKDLIITLKDNNGKTVSGYKLQVKVNGVTKLLTTNSKGQVKLAVGKLVPKTHAVSIKGANNKHYLTIVGSTKVTVKKATPKFTAANKAFNLNDKTKKYVVVLKDNVNKVIKNAKVTLKVNGVTYAAKTNAKGQAIFKLTKLNKRGKFTAVIQFAGNAYYNKLSKKVSITVK